MTNRAIVQLSNVSFTALSPGPFFDLLSLVLKIDTNFDIVGAQGPKNIDTFAIILDHELSPNEIVSAVQEAAITKIQSFNGPTLRRRDVLVIGSPVN